MLVLTRKKNDSIVIDGRITIQVLQVKGGGIRLGITAPSDVSILRGELKPFGVDGDGKRIEELLVPEGERGMESPESSDSAAASNDAELPSEQRSAADDARLRRALAGDPSRPRVTSHREGRIPPVFARRWRSA